MPGRAKIRVALALMLAGAASCAQIIGLEPFGSGGAGGAASDGGSANHGGGGAAGTGAAASTGSSSTGGAAGGAPCSPCLKAPHQWNGPVVLAKSCPTGSTPTTVTLPVHDLHCDDCRCLAPAACQVQIGTCGSGITAQTADEGCSPLILPQGDVTLTFTTRTGTDASCTTTVPGDACTPPVPETLTLCSLGACGSGGACVPAGEVACVYGAGSSCPLGFTDVEMLGYGNYHLSPCACDGMATGVVCDTPSVDFFSDSNCTQNIATATKIKCAETSDAGYVKYKPMGPGVCARAAVIETTSNPVRVCCAAAP